uniref:hypothetical protein n=1 Tax=Roseobacter weihaiensis TaxID=2763262 RepID=UPI001D0A111C|nr:hypothetical protein [Roseobacter sp. H9]
MSNGPWTNKENDLIVADYFAMLADDIAGNARVVRYLMQTRPEFLSEFQTTAEMESVVPVEAK